MSNELQKVNGSVMSLESDFNLLVNENRNNTVRFRNQAEFAMQLIQKNDFLLQTCMRNPQSLKNAILNIASTDITLNPAEKLAYLVPRDGQVCLDISYMGLSALAVRSGSIRFAQAKLIYSKDDFKYMGATKEPLHNFVPYGDRGEVVAVYCLAFLESGECLPEVMSKEECLDIRNRTQIWKKSQKGPWKTDENEMLKKTVIKRAAKMWPKNNGASLLDKAIHVINETEGIEFEEEGKEEVNQAPVVNYQAKNDLLEEIKMLCGFITKTYSMKEKMEFLKVKLGVKSFTLLKNKTEVELEEIKIILTDMNSFSGEEEKPIETEFRKKEHKSVKDVSFTIGQ